MGKGCLDLFGIQIILYFFSISDQVSGLMSLISYTFVLLPTLLFKRHPMSNEEICNIFFCRDDLCETPPVLSTMCQQPRNKFSLCDNQILWLVYSVRQFPYSHGFCFLLCYFVDVILIILFTRVISLCSPKSNCSLSRSFDCPRITMMLNTVMATDKLPATLLVQQLFRRAPDKTSKPRITGPLWGKFNGDWWIPLIKGLKCGQRSHVMTYWWIPWDDRIKSNSP